MAGIALLLNTREIEQMNGIRAWMMAVITFALVGAARSASPLKKLKPEHPRLMLTDTRLTELKQQAQTDETLQRFVREVITQADGHLDDSAFKYKEKGSLLGMSRACVDRIYTLGVAWRWTGDVKYAAKIKENLLTVCAFPAWNPDHFLDAAEMAHAVGIGYDWIYDYLDAESRERIEQALIHNALKPGIERYERKYKHFTYAYNWNQVCNGGLLMASLAIAEADSKTTAFVVEQALEHLPTALGSYAPDGVWAEGIGYWNYATDYTAFALAALETALGSDLGLSKAPGLSQTGYVPMYSAGPTGLFFSYADAADFSKRKSAPCMFWLARTFKNPDFSDYEHDCIERVEPFHVIWYVAPSGKKAAALKRDRLLHGAVDVALMRSAWDDPDALFVGVKAGYNQAHHGHLDLGNFELDALGVRWARDLGADSYSLPSYWTYGKGGKRWTYYRLGSLSHNVPVLDGNNQDPYAKASIERFESGDDISFAVVDLSEAYSDQARSVRRGVALLDQRRAVLVQDEFELKKSCEVMWGMTTDAEIVLEKDGKARLQLDGKALMAQILSPAGAEFAMESAAQSPPQKTNEGVNRLIVRLPGARGSLRTAILFVPEWKDGASTRVPTVKSLKSW
jgi:hypothetical protein